jgi:hypothetical protein
LRTPRGPRVALAALACWAIGTLILTGSPEDSTWRVAAVNVVYFTAVAFALVFLARTASATRGRERLFWGLLVAGSLVGLVGDLGWGEIQRSAFTALESSNQHAAYLAFYLLFVCALLLLVSSTTSRITLMAFLDSLCIMLSVGMLVWYFFLGRMVVEDGSGLSWTVLAVFFWPLFDVALLFLCLAVYSTTGPPLRRASGGRIPGLLPCRRVVPRGQIRGLA